MSGAPLEDPIEETFMKSLPPYDQHLSAEPKSDEGNGIRKVFPSIDNCINCYGNYFLPDFLR